MRWLVIAIVCLTGCDPGGVSVAVELRTDLLPGREIARFRVESSDQEIGRSGVVARTDAVEGPIVESVDYVAGARIAELPVPGPSGTRYIRATVLDAGGREVARQTIVLNYTRTTLVTVIIQRACAGVECPRSGQPEGHTFCLGGACYDESCATEPGPECPEDECAADDDCGAGSPCEVPRCVAGACLSFADDAQCAGGSCVPAVGCVPDGADGGPPRDAGPAPVDDAGEDAGTRDAGPACPFGSFGGACEHIVQVDLGEGHGCARSQAGRVWCWGRRGAWTGSPDGLAPIPALLDGLSDASDVSCGDGVCCAVRTGGGVVCWGEESAGGGLGDGPGMTVSHTPVPVSGLADATDVSAGDEAACAVRSGGSVSCWGLNVEGRIGDGTAMTNADSPRAVMNLSGAVAVASGSYYSCAATAGGAVRCWGREFGSTTAAAVSGFSGVAQLHAAQPAWRVCGVDGGGGVRCVGDNRDDALGVGRGGPADSPTAVSATVAPAGVDQVVTGSSHTCARHGGRVFCWGGNGSGQLGDGTTVDREDGVAVPSLTNAVDLTAAANQTCAALSDGGLVCWGAGRDLGVPGAPVAVTEPTALHP